MIDYSSAQPQGKERTLEDLVFPGFLEQRPDGVFINTDKLSSCLEMNRLVDRVFTSSACFQGLDYPVFIQLLYHFDGQGQGMVRLADAIRLIPEARHSLYRAVKISKGEVEYVFEPVLLETSVEEPVMGENEFGEPEVLGMQTRVVQEKTLLSFDEFIAELWLKGIRYGVDESAVRAAIESEKIERMTIARPLPAKPGTDAGIEEQTPELHRDDAPRQLANGRMDLCQFKNRFPQMLAGAVLLKKVPRQLGLSGFTIQGVAVMPPVPKDFELGRLAGPGTRVEKTEAGDFILAAMDGFLSLDARTNQISITDKIVNRDGVSARTTGDLALAGDEYEEFGEVQERRTVEGKNITLHADVFGRIVSLGGLIHIDHNLVGGSAFNNQGDIEVAGLASGATLESPKGEVRIKRAENCLITAQKVVIEWATNCTILAQRVEIMMAEGCSIGTRSAQFREARARGQQETVVSILTPDLSTFDKRLKELARQREETGMALSKLTRDQEALMTLPELQRYLALAPRIQKKELVLNAEQQGSWQRLVGQIGPDLQKLLKLRQTMEPLKASLQQLEDAQAKLEQEKTEACAGLQCEIGSVVGEVRVHTRIVREDDPPLLGQPAKALATQLRTSVGKRLFAGSRGSFSWNWDTPLI